MSGGNDLCLCIRVFHPTEPRVYVLPQDQSIADVLSPEAKHEFFAQEQFMLFYDRDAYFSRDHIPLCAGFEHYVREAAPYAPDFRGTLVLLDQGERPIEDFVAACARKWSMKAVPCPEDEIPVGLLKTFSVPPETKGPIKYDTP